MLSGNDAELKLVIAGNHDLELDKNWSDSVHDDAEGHLVAFETMTGPLAAAASVTYLQEWIYTFTLTNGTRFTVHASPYSSEFNSWAFTYDSSEDRSDDEYNVAKGVTSIAKQPVPDFPAVDNIMTHGPPKGILDQCPKHTGCDDLLRPVRRARPKLHCFGHIHEAGGARLVDWENEKRGMSEPEVESLKPPYVREIPNLFSESILYSMVHGQ